MDTQDLQPNQNVDPDLLTHLAVRLGNVDTIPVDPDMQYLEPVNDSDQSGDWLFPVPNEGTYDKLARHVEPESGTAALTVGSMQGFQTLAMYPTLASLDVVDISPAAVTSARALIELPLRIQQLTGRTPTAGELIQVLSDAGQYEFGAEGEPDICTPPLVNRVLSLPPANQGQQHTFGSLELSTIKSSRHEIVEYLTQQLSVSPDCWLQPQHLERVLGMYRTGRLQIHQGSILGGEVMEHLRQRQPPFGYIYISNVVGGGYHTLSRLGDMAKSFSQLPLSENPLFVQAVGNVVGPDCMHWRPQGRHDWPYLVLRSLPSFLAYIRPDNPALHSARITSSPVTIRLNQQISRRPLTLNNDGVIVEQLQQQAAQE